MKKYLLLLPLLLSACATPEEIEARRQAQMQADYEVCKDYGFKQNSDALRNCMLQLELARQQRYNNNYYYGGYYGHRYPGASVGYYLGR